MLILVLSSIWVVLAVTSVIIKFGIYTWMAQDIRGEVGKAQACWVGHMSGLKLLPFSVLVEIGVMYLFCSLGWLYWWCFTVTVIVVIINCSVSLLWTLFLNKARA